MHWFYGNRMAKNPNILHLHMLIRQILSSKTLVLGQNPSFWQHCWSHRCYLNNSQLKLMAVWQWMKIHSMWCILLQLCLNSWILSCKCWCTTESPSQPSFNIVYSSWAILSVWNRFRLASLQREDFYVMHHKQVLPLLHARWSYYVTFRLSKPQ